MSKEKTNQTVQTTGHAWDGDLQEFNNPLPRWWLWGFYASVVFALVYWLLFPAWPMGKSFTKGIKEVTFATPEGKEVTTHWNSRSLLQKDIMAARKEQAKYIDQLKAASYTEIVNDDEKSAFAYSMAKVLFADNCAACHQTGGNGVVGSYPNLLDDDWLWGGKFEQISNSITNGHAGFMPAFKASLNEQQLSQVADYVLSLSGEKVEKVSADAGSKIFNGATGGCYYCHDKGGVGKVSVGSANLTDGIWTVANIPAEETLEGKKSVIMHVVENGINRTMPAWKDRLSETEIKILTFYVHELGAGL